MTLTPTKKILADDICETCEVLPACEYKYGKKLCTSCRIVEDREVKERAAGGRATNLPVNYRENPTIIKSQEIDAAIQVRTDIFNAETVSIAELKSAIEADETIENKKYALAELVTERVNNFKQKIFDINELLVAESTRQRAAQTYLNSLANGLRAEERERLKLLDLNYKPADIKQKQIKPKVVKVSKKFDKDLVRKLALESGFGEYTIQGVCVSKGMQPADAVKFLKAAQATMLAAMSAKADKTEEKS